MTSLKEHIERLQIKYDLKREYFTIGIPVVIAILMIIIAFGLGQVELPGAANQTAQISDKEKAYQELMAQLNAENGVTQNTSLTTQPIATPNQKWGLDQILIFATLIAIIPYSVDITIQKRKTRRKEELYTEFLFKLSELMRGGLDPIKAVKELSKTDMGDLSPHVKMAATALTFGKSFEESMKRMAASLHSEIIRRYTSLVVQASYSGGSVSDLILKSSEDMRSIIGIEREKEGSLSQYTFIFYFAQGIIVFIAYIMITSLLPYLSGMGGTTLLGGGTNQLAGMNFALGFFHLLMINAFFGGLIIGKITEGDAKYGLKHSAILMIGCYIASM
ncbi:MAG TPA: type II secretion system F family protein, partial [Methanoregulaceae archaeon]|nr:type II secretion system F family protein [Methanoregulaceae archaeon]